MSDAGPNTVTLGTRSVAPSKMVCIGRNYAAHAAELGNEIPPELVVFMKPNSAIGSELRSCEAEPIHYEGEICLMVRDGEFAAVAFGLDLTKRGLQNRLKADGLPWERCKAFDGSALFSPFVEISGVSPTLSLKLTVNGSTVQQDGVGSMIFKPAAILAELKTFVTLNDYDIVMTGTPKGVGVVNPGDLLEGEIREGDQVISTAQWHAL